MHVANLMLSSATGGLEQSAVDYANMLRHRSHQVTSIISQECAYAADIKRASSKTFFLENKGPWDIFAARRLTRILRTSGAQAVICHGNRAFAMARSARLKNTAVIAVTHNTKIKPLAKADGVFAVTHAMHQHALQRGVRDDVLYYVPNMARIPMQPSPFKFFQPPVNIATLGRLSPEKGIDTLLEAAALLLETEGLPDIRIVIGGDGPERKALEKKSRTLGVASHVTFAGWINESETFLRKADIFCHPSRRETFGIALAEAMGAGLPCVATDCDGPKELISSRAEGTIIGKDDPQALAEALITTLRMTELELKEQRAAAFLSASRYNMTTVSDMLHNALEVIISPS